MNERRPQPAIAIVGLGGVFPGAADLDAFWQNVLAGRDAARQPEPGRWTLDLDDAYSPTLSPDKVNSRRACFVDDVSTNVEGLCIDAALVDRLDPMCRLALRAGRDAWRSAQVDNTDPARVGVILGNIALPTEASGELADAVFAPLFDEQILRPIRGRPQGVPHHTTNTTQYDWLNRYVAGLPAGLLAQALGLGGGSWTLDAACASSLYALKYACDELVAGRADAMLAGGLSRPDSLYTQMGFSQLRAVSPTGTCSPFDLKANGLVVGEGCGVVVLKRLDDALRDGDRVYALVRGIGLSNDIEGNIMLPASEGQLRAMRAAYRAADWLPRSVDLIECHGTGTPRGDAVEFNSLRELWDGDGGRDRDCVIGSVKSNVGHLLTAAGSAGLIKTLLAMRDGVLPPTANFERAGDTINMRDSPFDVLREARPWEQAGAAPRRAAVSAFGFGGINAHVLLESFDGDAAETVRASRSFSGVPAGRSTDTTRSAASPVAVVGMAAHFGPWDSLDAFAERAFGGDADVRPTRPRNWWGVPDAERFVGYFIDEVRVPLRRFRIPPSELKAMLPQQLLMLRVAAEALDDAGVGDIDEARLDTGVFIGIGLDLNTTNFHFRWSMLPRAKRWLEQLEIDAEKLEPGALDQWVSDLRDAVSQPLSADRTMGALGGIVASRVARAFRVGGPSFTVSSEETSGLRAVEAAVRSLQRGELDSAIVGAVDLAGDVRAVLGHDDRRKLASSADDARPFDTDSRGPVVGEGASAVILKRLDDARRDGDRVYAVIDGVGGATASNDDVLISPPAKTIESAARRAWDDAGASSRDIGWVEAHGSGHPEEDAAECAALALLLGDDESASSRAIACGIGSVKADVGHTGAAGGLASLVRACLALHRRELPPVRGLTRSRDALAGHDAIDLPRAPRPWLRDRIDGPRRAGVSAVSVDGNATHVVLREGDSSVRAASGVTESNALSRKRQEKVAFVFPGAGNQVVGMSRQLAVRWPEVVEAQDAANERLASQFAHGRFWTRDDLSRIAHRDVIFGQVWHGAFVSDLLRSFSLEPGAMIGYSLGETTAMFASGAWDAAARDEMLRRMDASSLFVSDLTGRCDVVRSFWGLQGDESVDWCIGLVNCDADDVRAAIEERFADKRVYLLIVNAPGECVIGGQRGDVLALANQLGSPLHTVDGVTTVHGEFAHPVRDAYRDLHLFDTTRAPDGIDTYSGAWGRRFDVSPDSAADSITAQAMATLDFHRVIEQAHEDGVRVFVEVGPGASCTRMIGKTLAGRPHTAVSVAPGTAAAGTSSSDEVAALRRALTTLRDAGVEIDFDRFEAPVRVVALAASDAGEPTIAVPVGGQPFDVPAPPSVPVAPSVEVESPIVESAGIAEAVEEVASRVEMPVVAGAAPVTTRVMTSSLPMQQLVAQAVETEAASAAAAEAFLRLSADVTQTIGAALAWQMRSGSAGAGGVTLETRVLQSAPTGRPLNGNVADDVNDGGDDWRDGDVGHRQTRTHVVRSDVFMDRAQCMTFAIGAIGDVLGERFASIDAHPTRVRLPDEPLMLVDRVVSVEGEPASLTTTSPDRVHGRVVTEHDILPGAWYLDNGRIPTCIAVEAGQADLFLSGYLGIDFHTGGHAVYRLLDAVVTFHQPLPVAGQTIHYDIRINHFERQGDMFLFRFEFDATVGGQSLLTMRDGCAGFFTEAELDAGQGIVLTTMDKRPGKGVRPNDWVDLAPRVGDSVTESYDDAQLDALRSGNADKLVRCFGDAFSGLALDNPSGLPGGRMTLVHRIVELDQAGGRFGLGRVVGEADIHPDDWFLICHFCDDQVMPGTLMYECCLHTLRVLLLRMGWVGEADEVVYEPVPGVSSQLKCRGQVLASTRKVRYELVVKEIGYEDGNGTPYVLADALMYGDGKPIVQMRNMSLRLNGLTRERVELLWQDLQTDLNHRERRVRRGGEDGSVVERSQDCTSNTTAGSAASVSSAVQSQSLKRPAIFDTVRITAFAIGNPSDAFGDRYRVFDHDRKIARLPGPPFQFLDRIVSIADCEPWVLKAGGVIEAQYDPPEVPPELPLEGAQDGWYFNEERQPTMPFAVLLETALQPCGWLAAYLGSALTSDTDLSFRNLGGKATQFLPVTPGIGTLTTRVKITNVSQSGGMTIQHFDYDMTCAAGRVYQGDTYFGFFSQAALADQVGIRDAKPYEPTGAEWSRGEAFDYPADAPFPGDMMRMVDRVTLFDPAGGPSGLGFIRGEADVDPSLWFFKAHFYQDPVWPGSLGLESFLQLMKVVAARRWMGGELSGGQSGGRSGGFECVALGVPHAWTYRGQVLPTDERVTVQAVVTGLDDATRTLSADGFLSVDGRVIYQMDGFAVRVVG